MEKLTKAKNLLSRFPKTVEWSSVVRFFVFLFGSSYAVLHGGFWAWTMWIFISLWFFYKEERERSTYRNSYIAYCLFVIVFGAAGNILLSLNVLFVAVSVIILFIWMGLVRFIFREKELVTGLLHLIILFVFGLFLFSIPNIFFSLVFSLVAFSLLYEYFSLFQFPWKKRVFLIITAISLIVFEGIYIVSIFPVNTIFSVGILLLLFLAMRNASMAHLKGEPVRNYLFQNLAIFLGFFILFTAFGMSNMV